MEDGIHSSCIKTYLRCPRRAAYDHLVGRQPAKPGSAAERGTHLHKVAEDWHKKIAAPDLTTPEGRLFAAGLKHNPSPGSCQAEHYFCFRCDGIQYAGTIDLLGAGTIYDHKTTSSIERRSLSEEQLMTDPQAILYGLVCMVLWPVAEVQACWIYYEWGTNRTKSTRVLLAQDHLEREFRKLHLLGQEITSIQAMDPVRVRRNLSACNDYGGCPHIETCHNS